MATSKRLLNSRREEGSVIVEMSVIIPLLLLMVAGIIDLGMLYWEKEVLTNAAREGARAGARAITDNSGNGRAQFTSTAIRTLVQTYLQANNIRTPAGGLITLNTSNCIYTYNTSTPATISVELKDIPVKMMVLPNIQTLFGVGEVSGTVNLNAKITMAAEWVTPPSS